ncbi:MAG: hypothetical protein ACK5LT_10545, partial [Lachnospirales bacterium]
MEIIILENENIRVQLLPFGATIYKLFIKDKKGKWENIVLSYPDCKEYKSTKTYFGMTCGRHAGRIVNGKFSIDGKEYQADINNKGHSLHGGTIGISHKLWSYKMNYENCVSFFLESPDGDMGFPGNVKIEVIYTLEDNTLTVEYKGVSDKNTLLNLTNHSYFNLSGDLKEAMYEHKLQINADKFINTDEFVNAVSVDKVDGTDFDF